VCRAVFLFGALAGCHSTRSEKAPSLISATSSSVPPDAATSLTALMEIDLPSATHSSPLLGDDVPIISVTGDKIRCQGAVVGDAAAIVTVGRPQRVDGLWDSLKHARESWQSSHAGASFPGIALFAFDRRVPALVFKSVFQTAAFAGYPNAEFAVRTTAGKVARFDVDAIVPSPTASSTAPEGDRLLVAVRISTYELVWRKNGTVVSTIDVASATDLPDAVRKEFTTYSAHQTSADPVIDQAVLFVSDDVDYAGLVAVIDAIDGTTRDFAAGDKSEPRPALNVTLGIAKDLPTGDPFTSAGRIKPELIKQAVQQNAGRFRACYEKGRARNNALAGTARIHFVIQRDGTVTDVADDASTLPDPDVVSCIMHVFAKVTFAKPEGGIVTVTYPLAFKP
jgi:hypothetical protein